MPQIHNLAKLAGNGFEAMHVCLPAARRRGQHRRAARYTKILFSFSPPTLFRQPLRTRRGTELSRHKSRFAINFRSLPPPSFLFLLFLPLLLRTRGNSFSGFVAARCYYCSAPAHPNPFVPLLLLPSPLLPENGHSRNIFHQRP